MMRKKIILLIMAIFTFMYSNISVNAAENVIQPRATNYVVKKTSGGVNGWVNVEFRCTCVQDSISTNYSWSSSIKPPSNTKGFTYKHNGSITLEDFSHRTYSSSLRTYSMSIRNALIGGRADMSISSIGFGSAKASISVMR